MNFGNEQKESRVLGIQRIYRHGETLPIKGPLMGAIQMKRHRAKATELASSDIPEFSQS